MAVTSDRRKAVQRDIKQWLEEGDQVTVEVFHQRYPDIPVPTFYRWVKQIKDSGAPARKAAQKAQAHAKRLAKTGRPARKAERAAKAVQKILPQPVTPDSINPISSSTSISLVHECIEHAREALKYCRTEDGRIRNLKGFLQASTHMRSSVETLAKVSERLTDAQKMDQVHAAIFEEIRAADPATAQRILIRIQRLKESWGLN